MVWAIFRGENLLFRMFSLTHFHFFPIFFFLCADKKLCGEISRASGIITLLPSGDSWAKRSSDDLDDGSSSLFFFLFLNYTRTRTKKEIFELETRSRTHKQTQLPDFFSTTVNTLVWHSIQIKISIKTADIAQLQLIFLLHAHSRLIKMIKFY